MASGSLVFPLPKIKVKIFLFGVNCSASVNEICLCSCLCSCLCHCICVSKCQCIWGGNALYTMECFLYNAMLFIDSTTLYFLSDNLRMPVAFLPKKPPTRDDCNIQQVFSIPRSSQCLSFF